MTENFTRDEFRPCQDIGPWRATLRGRERFAADNLALRGYETFIPRIRLRIDGRWRTVPLFVNYLFVRVYDRWRAIESSPGVIGLIKFGETPGKCPDEEVGRLLAQSDRDGIIRFGHRPPAPSRSGSMFAKGAPVMISAGNATFNGLHSGQSAGEREIILLTILGAQRPVAVPANLIHPRL